MESHSRYSAGLPTTQTASVGASSRPTEGGQRERSQTNGENATGAEERDGQLVRERVRREATADPSGLLRAIPISWRGGQDSRMAGDRFLKKLPGESSRPRRGRSGHARRAGLRIG